MPYITSATAQGLSRADGTSNRSVNMVRVGQVANGFILREDLAGAPDQRLAQQLTHRTFEVRTKAGLVTRHSSTEWKWPFEVSTAPGVVAGEVTLNRTGLHVPAHTPVNVRKDIRSQLANMASGAVGTVGYALVYQPLVAGDYPA